MKAPAIKPSSWPGTSNATLVKLVKYSLTVSPSFCLKLRIECEAPLYFLNYMIFVKNRYFNFLKLYMLPGLNVLNHIPALSSKVVGKYVH